MIYDLRDPAQRYAFAAAVATHELIYGNAYASPVGSGLVLLLEPWLNPVAAS